MSHAFFLCFSFFFFFSYQLWEDGISKGKNLPEKWLWWGICAFGEWKWLHPWKARGVWNPSSLHFLNSKLLEGILTENLQRTEVLGRLTDTSSAATTFFLLHFMPLFAVSLNTSGDLLVFFFSDRVALIPAQLTGLSVPRTQHLLSPG